jgi:hypothetical protein
MRKALFGLGVLIAFAFALVVLLNALSGFLPRIQLVLGLLMAVSFVGSHVQRQVNALARAG